MISTGIRGIPSSARSRSYRWDSVSWHIPAYQQVTDPTTNPPGVMQMPAQDWDNSATYTSRLRLKMGEVLERCGSGGEVSLVHSNCLLAVATNPGC